MNTKWLVPALIVLGLAACSSAPKKTASGSGGSTAPRPTTVVQGHGGGRGECPEGSPYA